MANAEFELHTAQFTIHNAPARFKVVSAGRRFGKTRLAVMECISVANDGGRAWWVSPTYKTSEVGWRPLRQMARRIPGADIRLADKQIILPGGGSVDVRSADKPDGLRGEGLDYVVMDECAFMQREAWTEAIRPALSDRLGSALFISTPKGRNWFWEIHQRGTRGEEGWQSFVYPTSANPFIDKREIEAAKRDMPEIIFRQEYLAEFVESDGGVFRRVQEAAILTPQDYQQGKQYVAGVDVAASVDYTVVTVMDAESKGMVYLDRFNRVDYPVLIDRLEAVYKRYHLTSMVVESNSIGRPVIDELVSRGLAIIPFTTTSATKQAIIQSLQSAFENGQIRVLDDPVLVGELLSYESKRNASGSFSYSAPDGMHDDCVMSLAIAWSGMQERVQVIKNPFYEY